MRKLVKIGVGAIALGALFAWGNTADAASYQLDYSGQKLVISNESDEPEILIGYGNAVKAVKGVDTLTIAKEDTIAVDGSEATVDLSHLNFKKDNYITIRGISDEAGKDVKLIHIPALSAKRAAVVDYYDNPVAEGEIGEEKTSVVMTDTTNKKDPVELSNALQYRTAYSNWMSAEDADFDIYLDKGATLYFRTAPAKTASNLKFDDVSDLTVKIAKVDMAKVTKFEAPADSLPGVEVKAKIAKRANAQALAANYAAQAVTALVGEDAVEARLIQYSYDQSSEEYSLAKKGIGEWKSVKDLFKDGDFDTSTIVVAKTSGAKTKWNIPLSQLTLRGYGVGKTFLEIRNKAEDAKPASAISRISLNEVPSLSVASTATDKDDDQVAYNVIGWKNGAEEVASVKVNDELTIALNTTENKNKKTKETESYNFAVTVQNDSVKPNPKKSITGTNTTYRVVMATEKPVDFTAPKGAVVAKLGGKPANLKVVSKVESDATIPNDLEGMRIYVARVENKGNESDELKWATGWQEVGRLVWDKAAEDDDQ